jgi:hypothetical protein
MRPDAPLAAFVRRLQRRTVVRRIAEAAAWAGGSGAAAVVGLRALDASSHRLVAVAIAATAVAAIGLATGLRRRSWAVDAVVSRAESVVPAFRNQLVTAVELARDGAGASPRIADLVARRAAAVAERTDARLIVPLARPVALGLAALLALAALTFGVASDPSGSLKGAVEGGAMGSPASARIDRIDVRRISPAYAGGQVREDRDPVRLDVLAGTRIELRIHSAAAVQVHVDDRPATTDRAPGSTGPAVAALTAEASAAIVVSAMDGAGAVRIPPGQ